jgi:glutaredoxin-related protein
MREMGQIFVESSVRRHLQTPAAIRTFPKYLADGPVVGGTDPNADHDFK